MQTTIKQLKAHLSSYQTQLRQTPTTTNASQAVSYLFKVSSNHPHYSEAPLNRLSKHLLDYLLNYNGGMIFNKDDVLEYLREDKDEAEIKQVSSLKTDWIDAGDDDEYKPVGAKEALGMINHTLKRAKSL